ncbi:MAG TPA: DUF4905 domain-containing protein [Bacteroidota bacterium]|nr:DUF4905 domain-containing protein [Bacteroidota bacterium]
MNISSLFQQKQLKPAWSYDASGVLWRLLFSDTNFIVGEDRNTETKEVEFFCLNAVNGDLLWKGNSFGEAWWIGIEGVVHDKVFLHGFKKPDMPEHSKIVAVDLGTGRELWRDNHYAFLYATKERVMAFRDMFEKRLYYELDAATGEFMQELKEAPSDLYERKNASHGRNDLRFPEPFDESSAEYPLIASFVTQVSKGETVRGSVEYVRMGGKLVMNFHSVRAHDNAKNNDDLQNTLVVIDESNGKRLYTDIVNSSTPTPAPDSFFVDDAVVYYIKEKHTLVALPLIGQRT